MYPRIRHIIVVWRPRRSYRRIPVAIVDSNGVETTFQYLKDGVEQARKEGFVYFPDFPDIEKRYEINVLKRLAFRINDNRRSDIQDYYSFWEVPEEAQKDIYRLLAYTQGILATDNFEFLAEYNDVQGVKFVTEVAGLSVVPLESTAIEEGDELEWRREPDNSYDPKAVALYKNGQKIGYVKKVHSLVFYLPNSECLKVKVKKLVRNGHIAFAFILIYNGAE